MCFGGGHLKFLPIGRVPELEGISASELHQWISGVVFSQVPGLWASILA